MTPEVTQSAFRAAMLNADCPAPKGLVGPNGQPAGKRFDVYRNNVAVSLTEALMTAFPVILKLVGEEFFRAMAGVYLRTHPPVSPLMMHYGQHMPDFLQTFEPVRHIGYLPDMARLELARRRAYHAADAQPISASEFQSLTSEEIAGLPLALAPCVRVIKSDWPLYDIWRMNTEDAATLPGKGPQHILISRPEFDPVIDPLTPEASRFVLGFSVGQSLDDALNSAPDRIEPGAVLGLLLSRNALTKAKQ